MPKYHENTCDQLADRSGENHTDRNRSRTLGNIPKQHKQCFSRSHGAVGVGQSGIAAAIVADILAQRHLADDDGKAQRAQQVCAHCNDHKPRKCHSVVPL